MRWLFLSLLLFAAQLASALAIIPMNEWGGTPIAVTGTPQTITRLTVHHQGETWVVGNDVPAYLRRLQKWSRETKHWADIPYHYVIAPDGRVYAARPEGVAGDTNTEYDPKGHLLVMLLGNFEEVEPTPEALESLVELLATKARETGLDERAIASHRDWSTQTVCPGKNLYRYLENGWLKNAVAARLKEKLKEQPTSAPAARPSPAP